MFKNNNHEFLYYLRHNRGTYNTNKLKFAMSIATKVCSTINGGIKW